MFCQGSRFLLGFTCFFVLTQSTVGIECEPGQKANVKRTKCERCPSNQYRPTKGGYIECLNCIPCKYSRQVAVCTLISNTKCECWEGFSLLPGSSTECRCIKGSGMEELENGEKVCKKCSNGTFTSRHNSKCQQWKTCDHNGVKVPGNTTTDVVCKKTHILDKTSASTLTPPVIATHPAPADIFTMEPNRTATTKKPLVSTTTSPGSAPPGTKQMQLQHWLVPLSCVLALILIQLAIIKLKVKTCFHKNKKRVIRQDSTCGKPVEESGEKFIPSAI